MKILFICGALEQNKDGVGDYTRRLAAESIKLGHEGFLLSFNDRFVSSVERVSQSFEGIFINTMRLPSLLKQGERTVLARQFVEEVDPEWISLQFVIFSYHTKGLPVWLGNDLKKIVRGKPCEIMFHELWVGIFKDSSKKHVLWGEMQRYIIKSILNKVKPGVIHTNIDLYSKLLAKAGFGARKLPLFGNIPVSDGTSRAVSQAAEAQNDQSLSFVIFGHIHPYAPIYDFTTEVALFAGEHNLKPLLKIIGRSGTEKEKWIKIWKGAGMEVADLGEQPANLISESLSRSNLGISTSAFVMIEKSGTVAAMKEHGLRVVCVSKPHEARNVINLQRPAGITEFGKDSFQDCMQHGIIQKQSQRAEQIASQFLSDLSNSFHRKEYMP